MNDNQFCFGSYSTAQKPLSQLSRAEDFILKQGSLNKMNYVMKDQGETPKENMLPNSFAITQFHIVFLYPQNMTVVSMISQQIVYSYNQQNELILREIQMDHRRKQLIVYCPKEKIHFATLKGEDQEAWKYYLH